MKSARYWVAVFGLALGIGACAPNQDLSPDAAADLQSRVEKVRTAVEADDEDAASRRLLEVERAVSRWLDAGAITEVRAARILSAATAVAARLTAIDAADPEPTPTITLVVTETATATATATVTSSPSDEEDNGKGHGKDKDKHEDDDDD